MGANLADNDDFVIAHDRRWRLAWISVEHFLFVSDNLLFTVSRNILIRFMFRETEKMASLEVALCGETVIVAT